MAQDKSTKKTYVPRPFEGLASEPALVSMREILPAATGLLKLKQGGQLRVVTVLPDLVRAWQQADGTPVIALQPAIGSDDVARDLGNAVVAAQAAEPGKPANPAPVGADGPRLQELIDAKATLELEVMSAFGYWSELDPEDEKLVEAAGESEGKLDPTEAVPGVPGAYWAKLNGREFLRWAMGVDEDALLDALARLQAKREAGVIDGAKYAGAFRALGVMIPVWELPAGTTADDLTEALAGFKQRFDAALATKDPLDASGRRARAGLVARSVSLR